MIQIPQSSYNVPNPHFFVKGFAHNPDKYELHHTPFDCDGEFFAIITDLVTSGYIKIKSATQNEGKWVLECSDGQIRTLEQEPQSPREMYSGKLVTNMTRNIMGHVYDVIFPADYESVREAINNGNAGIYQLVGYINKHEVATSKLVKFWTDPQGKHHGLTVSGSHYIF